MEWTADVSAGDWLHERLDDYPAGSMHDVVPRRFEAYVRILHPAARDRPVGAEWPREPYSSRAWDEFQTAHPDIEVIDERVDWATTAAAMGTTMHPLAQWGSLVRFDLYGNREDDPRDADGWRYHDPEQGGMPADVSAALAQILSVHTTTPDDGRIAIWEGWGGLVGGMGTGGSRLFLQFDGGDTPERSRHNAMLGSAIKDRFNSVFRRSTWQDGILSREISEGPRLELPARSHVLFRGGVAELAGDGWELDVPWRDRISEEYGFPPTAQTPSLVWPADRSWVWVSEIDFDSTVVGGSPELVAAIVADPRLEAFEIPAGARLTDDSDEVNR